MSNFYVGQEILLTANYYKSTKARILSLNRDTALIILLDDLYTKQDFKQFSAGNRIEVYTSFLVPGRIILK